MSFDLELYKLQIMRGFKLFIREIMLFIGKPMGRSIMISSYS